MSEKKITIITGATGGLGREFLKAILQEQVNEIWCIARNQEKLIELQQDYGAKVVPMAMDLAKPEAPHEIEERLREQQPVISFLINNAGVGKMGTYQDFTVKEIQDSMQINCTAVVALCTICIPYMTSGSKILNVASQAAFQPDPYINLYAAGKAFVRSYTRALNMELRETGITATAVCPGWIKTDLLVSERNGLPIRFPGLVSPEPVVAKAVKDAKCGKDMSVCTLYVKYMHLLVKILPQKMIMRAWVRQVAKYN